MDRLLYFLRLIFVRTPREILVTLLKLIILFLIFIFVILLRLWEYLLGLLRTKNLYPEKEEEPCGRLPEAIIRRPDPAIYSQRLLQSQGLSVTWNNPDIWVARADDPTNVEPDSYHLVEDTDYIVSVRVHNASTDAAIGVRVRLNYRPWSFNSPDLVPVETDAAGNEVFRFVDVPPLSETDPPPQFHWHTPALEPGQEKKHYCLQASLHHPMDTNIANNMGQENTNVWRSSNPDFVRAGQEVSVEVPLFNFSRQTQTFQFDAIQYEINKEDTLELKLKTTHGYALRSLSQRLANFSPSLRLRQIPEVTSKTERTAQAAAVITKPKGFTFENQPRLVAVKNKYVGFDEFRDILLSRDYSLPEGMTIHVEGQTDKGIEIGHKEEKMVRFNIKIPDNAQPGSSYPINLVAKSAAGVLAGGVTLIFNIEEEN